MTQAAALSAARRKAMERTWEFEDPFRFGPVLGEMDEYLLGEGTHRRLWQVLGAHVITHEGVEGTHFAVWAPNAERVSVVGDFNIWDGRRHPMRRRGRDRGVGDLHSRVWAKARPTSTKSGGRTAR